MNRYQPRTPRIAFGIASAALTLLTLTVFVAVPAALETPADSRTLLAAPAATGAAPVEVTIIPSRIEVVGVRERTVADTQPTATTRLVRTGG